MMALVNANIKQEPKDTSQAPDKIVVKIEQNDADPKLLVSCCESCKTPIDPRWAEIQSEPIKTEPPENKVEEPTEKESVPVSTEHAEKEPLPQKEHVEREGLSVPQKMKRSLSVDENCNSPKFSKHFHFQRSNKNNNSPSFHRKNHFYQNRRPNHHPHNFNCGPNRNYFQNHPQSVYFGNNVNRNLTPYWKHHKKKWHRNFNNKQESKPEKEIRVLRMTSSSYLEKNSLHRSMDLLNVVKENIEPASSPSTFSDKENLSQTGHCSEDSQNAFSCPEDSQDTVVVEENRHVDLSGTDHTARNSMPISFKSVIGIDDEEFLILDETDENSNHGLSNENFDSDNGSILTDEFLFKETETSDKSANKESNNATHSNKTSEVHSALANEDEAVENILISENENQTNDPSLEKDDSSQANLENEGQRQCLTGSSETSSGSSSSEGNRELEIICETSEIEVVKEVQGTDEIKCIMNRCKEAHICAKCFVQKKKVKKDNEVICLGKRKNHSCKENVPLITLEDTED